MELLNHGAFGDKLHIGSNGITLSSYLPIDYERLVLVARTIVRALGEVQQCKTRSNLNFLVHAYERVFYSVPAFPVQCMALLL